MILIIIYPNRRKSTKVNIFNFDPRPPPPPSTPQIIVIIVNKTKQNKTK